MALDPPDPWTRQGRIFALAIFRTRCHKRSPQCCFPWRSSANCSLAR
jgi:hypothetical protein